MHIPPISLSRIAISVTHPLDLNATTSVYDEMIYTYKGINTYNTVINVRMRMLVYQNTNPANPEKRHT